jgi:hypothetical protein
MAIVLQDWRQLLVRVGGWFWESEELCIKRCRALRQPRGESANLSCRD